MGSVEDEVKQLIIDVLQLEDITLADIDTDAPLFVDGLGLDSIDALERGWLSISVMGYPCRAMRFVATIVASLLTLFDPCWVWINTLSRQIKDSMCGFRVYPLAPIIALDQRQKLGARMNFDIEVLVRLYWDGLKIINIRTPVSYPSDGVSHFRGLVDNFLISRMHTTLFFGMLLRLPLLIARHRRAR